MRKLGLFAIIVLAIGITAFHSCKKDEELTNNNETKALTSTFNPNEIKNMDEYLMGFMKELKNATRDSEPMTIEDAEWHLSACLNFMYCNTNVVRTHVVYDTITTTINVIDGNISLSDINSSMQEISAEVQALYNTSDVENKNILFIKPEIQDDSNRNGNVVKTVVAISGGDVDFGYYYFDNDSIPLSLFPENAEYSWVSEAIDTLLYFINVFKPTKVDIPGRVYYVVTSTLNCKIDEGFGGRLFYAECSYSHDYKLNQQQMAYYLDSYLGLIDEVRPELLSYISSDIKPWGGEAPYYPDDRHQNYIHHELIINYGQAIYTMLPPIH